MIHSLGLYQLFNITCGLPLGVLSMTSEMIILEIQPTTASGKISGAKGLLRNWLKAIALLLVGLFWDITHNSFYYAAGISLLVALLNTFGMMLAKKKHSLQINQIAATN